MVSQLAANQFQSAVDRFLAAREKVLPNWVTPCPCDRPGLHSGCQTCPYFKGYVLRLQAQIDVAPTAQFPSMMAPELGLPYPKEVRDQCIELFRLRFSMEEIQCLTGVTNRKTIRKWLYGEGLLPSMGEVTPEIRQQCLDLYASGLTVKEIEDQIRIGGDVIGHLVGAAGISRSKPNYSQQQRQESLQLYMQGWSLQNIEEKTQVYGPTVFAWAKAAGLHRERRYNGGRPRVYDQAFREDCLRLLTEGWTLPQVELEKGVSIDTIRKWRKEAQQSSNSE